MWLYLIPAAQLHEPQNTWASREHRTITYTTELTLAVTLRTTTCEAPSDTPQLVVNHFGPD
jgi:hypothetical protein